MIPLPRPSPHALELRILGVCLLLCAPGARADEGLQSDAARFPTPVLQAAGLSLLMPERYEADTPEAPASPSEVFQIPISSLPETRYATGPSAALVAEVLAEAVPANAWIIDLRTCDSDVEGVKALAARIARKGSLRLETSGVFPGLDQPLPGAKDAPATILVLLGPGTRGPVEALLAALAARGDVLTLGTRTAGRPGLWERLPEAEGWRRLVAEVRAPGLPSGIGSGFPPVLEVQPEPSEPEARRLIAKSRSLAEVIRGETNKPRFGETQLIAAHSAGGDREVVERTPAGGSAAPTPIDGTLQRAVAVLTALNILGNLPTEAKVSLVP